MRPPLAGAIVGWRHADRGKQVRGGDGAVWAAGRAILQLLHIGDLVVHLM
jgi:hypothetical protein